VDDVLSRIEQHGRARPDAVATRRGEWSTTYDELLTGARALAATLRSCGVGEEELVGVLLEDRARYPQTVVGVWMADAAFLPLGTGDPPTRRNAVIRDAGLRVVVTTRRWVPALPAGMRPVLLDELAPVATYAASARPLPADRLAYAISTSGSTGVPKAALLEHRGLAALAAWTTDGPLAVTPKDRVLQWAPPTVDAFVAELIQALACGGTLVFPPVDADLVDLATLLAEGAVTVATLTPTVWREVPDAALNGLRVALTAGERCPPDVATRLQACHLFVNAYGPTEATVCATAAVAPDDHRTIGWPIGTATAAVVPPGDDAETGELAIGGPGVARGYLGRPGLTAERFVPDPASPVPGARRYLTGDRVRRDADGALEFLGRTDDQVKVRGFRVELGDVEHALAADRAVAAAAAVTRPGVSGDELVAFVTLAPGADATPDGLRAHLRARVPEHLVPTRLHVVEDLPRTPWGKVDRGALEEPARAPLPVEVSTAEQEVIGVWRRVLSDDGIGLDDDFFDVGGDSLAAMRVVGELRRTRAPQLAVRNLFEHPTVRRLAAYIEAQPAA
jgi:amino acid adenylation domain-containing protein